MGLRPARQKRPTFVRRHAKVSLGYRRILVAVADNAESEQAADTACRLAAEHGASIAAVTVVEVPTLLPLDAHMAEEEADAHRLLDRAAAIAAPYGVTISTRVVRARDAAGAILEQARVGNAELLLVGAPARTRSALFGSTVAHVLKGARCRVMVISSPAVSRASRAPSRATAAS